MKHKIEITEVKECGCFTGEYVRVKFKIDGVKYEKDYYMHYHDMQIKNHIMEYAKSQIELDSRNKKQKKEIEKIKSLEGKVIEFEVKE